MSYSEAGTRMSRWTDKNTITEGGASHATDGGGGLCVPAHRGKGDELGAAVPWKDLDLCNGGGACSRHLWQKTVYEQAGRCPRAPRAGVCVPASGLMASP